MRKSLTSDDGLLPRDSMNTRAWAVTIPCAILVRILRDHLGRLRTIIRTVPPPRQWHHATVALAQQGCAAPAITIVGRATAEECRVERRRVSGKESVAHPALSHRAAVRTHDHVSSPAVSDGITISERARELATEYGRPDMEIPPYGWALIGVVGTTVGVVLLLPDLRSLWWTFNEFSYHGP